MTRHPIPHENKMATLAMEVSVFEELMTIRARFLMKLRCHNCHQITSREIESPDFEDAPGSAEELLGSAWLQRQSFECGRCENPVATLIGIKQIEIA